MNTGKVDVLLGLQWGDEGKGKVVDVLTPKYDVVARFQGGPNAGHTLEFEGQKYVDSFTSGVIFALEAVFAGIFSYFIFGEIVTPKFAVGAFLIFISVFAPKFSFHTGKASAERQMLKRS